MDRSWPALIAADSDSEAHCNLYTASCCLQYCLQFLDCCRKIVFANLKSRLPWKQGEVEVAEAEAVAALGIGSSTCDIVAAGPCDAAAPFEAFAERNFA